MESAGAKEAPPNALGRTFTHAIFGSSMDVKEAGVTIGSNSETGDSDSEEELDDDDDDDILALRRKYGSPGGDATKPRRPLTREGVKNRSMEDLKRSLRERAKQRKTKHRLNYQK